MRLLRGLPFALAVVAAACSGGSDVPPDAGFRCDLDERDEEFVAGMVRTGVGGMTFTLVSSDPAPPDRNDNTWIIDIEQDGAPLTGAEVKVTPFMPDHGHGTTKRSTTTEVAGTPGRYQAVEVNLFMAGIWEITIEATPAGGGAVDRDSVVFTFCVAE